MSAPVLSGYGSEWTLWDAFQTVSFHFASSHMGYGRFPICALVFFVASFALVYNSFVWAFAGQSLWRVEIVLGTHTLILPLLYPPTPQPNPRICWRGNSYLSACPAFICYSWGTVRLALSGFFFSPQVYGNSSSKQLIPLKRRVQF